MRTLGRSVALLGLACAASCGRSDFTFTPGGGEGSTGSTGGSGTGTDTDSGSGSVTIADSGSVTFTTGDPTSVTDTFTTGDDLPTTDSDSDSDSDTTGDPPLCANDPECASGDPCMIGACEGGVCVMSARDADDDGVAPLSCGGGDCNDLNPNTFPGAPEDCFDGDDNDCNGVADCFDPACDDVPNCGCAPAPGGESCTNGSDDDCDTTVDCNDADCLGTPACGCAGSEGGFCVDGFDDDCDGAIDCDDSDCAGDSACTCMAAFEQCGNGEDDDCDLLVDCVDPDCEGTFSCTCVGGPSAEQCNDGNDNDCDGLVDCADPNCVLSPSCAMCVPEQCGNGQDDDCDGFIDCADDACVFDAGCMPQAEICNNDLDDDVDGAIDCDDSDCFAVPVCVQSQQNCGTAAAIFASGTFFGDTTGHSNNTAGTCGGGAGEAVFQLILFQPSHVILTSVGTSFDSVLYVRAGNCASGLELACDDDSGGNLASSIDLTLLQPGNYFVFLDGYTIDPIGGPNEGAWQLNVEIDANPVEVCNDVIDNDGDVYADCGDPDCVAAPGCAGCVGGNDPSAEFGVDACTNGVDDDCDGTIDCQDDDCSASDFYVTECCDGADENGNGIPDDFNCRCNNDAECGPGQQCYDHTADTCGIPCTSFFGDVCPFVAPGSTCNAATNQCEF